MSNYNSSSLLYRILFYSLFVLLISCDNSDEPFNPFFKPYYGSATVNINNEILEYYPYAKISKRDENAINLNLVYYNEEKILRGLINFINIPSKIDTHKIIEVQPPSAEGPGVLFNTFVFDGDVGGDLFAYSTMLEPSYVKISVWDSITMEIQGLFEIQLIRQPSITIFNAELPDTLQIAGSFLTIVEYK